MGQLKDVDKRHKSFVINILLFDFCNCLIHSNIAAPTKSFFKILCLQFVSLKIFSYLCSVFEMHRKCNFGERKRCFHPTVGADPRVCPKKRTGHSLAIGAEEDGRSQAEVRRGTFTGRSRVCQNKNNGRKVAACGPLLLGGGVRGGREK